MHDIFLSYSRQDAKQASTLLEHLSANGIDVWIDRESIGGADSWSKEIVQAIRECQAFVILLSNNSLSSNNVTKEVSIASELKKPILPIDLESVVLSDDIFYQLAGIQRAKFSDFDSIVRALTKIGMARNDISSPTKAELPNRSAPKDDRISLMVLPFEDLSPGKDNDWFADGLAGELIDALGHIKSLRLIDRKTSMDFKGFRGKTLEIADELNVRYFIEGNVRKFGEQIKISVSLLDVKEGDYLWQESHKGVFADIFEIQELVAEKVVAGLKLHLTKDEQAKVNDRGTENAEAFELNLQASAYLNAGTRQSYLHAIHLLETAIALDPKYAVAYAGLANCCMELYRQYSREPSLLDRAEQAINESIHLSPKFAYPYSMRGVLMMHRHRHDEAIAAAKKAVELDPGRAWSHFHLGFIYMGIESPQEAAEAFASAVSLQPDNLTSHYNLAIQYHAMGDIEKRLFAAQRALPYYEKYVRRHPDDQNKRTFYSILLFFAEQNEESKREMETILTLPGLDGSTCYNCACTYLAMKDTARALELFERAVDLGFVQKELFKGPDLDPLLETEAWKRIMKKLSSA